ncbi:MAG: hypothetical protein AAFQ41_09100 [Cyanobacteria bacterium J06623_7]
MTNLPNDRQNNLVSFLRHNQPLAPDAHPHLEQQLIDALPPHAKARKLPFKVTWKIPGAIATGFLFTSVSFGLRTPRIALEPKDLENFLVKNWQNTLNNNSYTAIEETEAYWLLPTVSEPQQTLSVSAQ